MINFRYHVVSLTAVFLALAIGLVVGTAALNGPLADSLNDRVNGLTKQNQQLRDQVGQLQEDVTREEDFAAEAAPYMLGGTLAGRDVLVLAMPSADGKYGEGVVQMLATAGARVAGRVELKDRFTDPANNVLLLDLAHQVMPASVSTLPRNSDGAETSAALLAAVLLDRAPAVPAEDRRRVLAAYQQAGYLAEQTRVGAVADAVVVVAGPPYVDRESARKNAAVVTVVVQFDEAGPVVLAGNGVAGEGNALTEVRQDPALSKTISTVDNVATPQGRVVAVLALVEQLRPAGPPDGVRAGHYGTEAGSTSLMPKRPE
ncbi:MAG TPA: copper transporter [Micromonosporaceae bacterium]|nr:copper transporter [Micromonosporaceae bacterium]